jgi:sugar-specific transcriptional regulator TrmB
MTNFLLKSISPQAATIYRLLESRQAMSAKDVGKRLGIFPNAVYRAVRQLLELGIVEELNGYPKKYAARPLSEGLDLFSSIMRQNFQETFDKNNKSLGHRNFLKITFVQKRSQTIKMTDRDTTAARENINLIASGLDLPAETLLVNKRAVERGVRVRLLVQNLKEVNADRLRSWSKAGIEVRYYPNMEARIYLFDHKIVYMTSYDPKNRREALGVRFEYPPLTALLDELFEQRWKLGKEIGSIV